MMASEACALHQTFKRNPLTILCRMLVVSKLSRSYKTTFSTLSFVCYIVDYSFLIDAL